MKRRLGCVCLIFCLFFSPIRPAKAFLPDPSSLLLSLPDPSGLDANTAIQLATLGVAGLLAVERIADKIPESFWTSLGHGITSTSGAIVGCFRTKKPSIMESFLPDTLTPEMAQLVMMMGQSLHREVERRNKEANGRPIAMETCPTEEDPAFTYSFPQSAFRIQALDAQEMAKAIVLFERAQESDFESLRNQVLDHIAGDSKLRNYLSDQRKDGNTYKTRLRTLYEHGHLKAASVEGHTFFYLGETLTVTVESASGSGSTQYKPTFRPYVVIQASAQVTDIEALNQQLDAMLKEEVEADKEKTGSSGGLPSSGSDEEAKQDAHASADGSVAPATVAVEMREVASGDSAHLSPTRLSATTYSDHFSDAQGRAVPGSPPRRARAAAQLLDDGGDSDFISMLGDTLVHEARQWIGLPSGMMFPFQQHGEEDGEEEASPHHVRFANYTDGTGSSATNRRDAEMSAEDRETAERVLKKMQRRSMGIRRQESFSKRPSRRGGSSASREDPENMV